MKYVINELKENYVSDHHIELILSKIKNKISEENINTELEKLGYNKIIFDNSDIFEEYDYISFEPYHRHKKIWR